MKNQINPVGFAFVLLVLSGIASAQMSIEEAQARAAERARAATQPTTMEYKELQREVVSLHKQIAALQAQVATLQAQNKQLQIQAVPAGAPANAGKPFKPESTFESRAVASSSETGQDQTASGQAAIAGAKQLDERIAHALKNHPEVSGDMASDAYLGNITVGMPWDVATVLALPSHNVVLEERAGATAYEIIPLVDVHVGYASDPSGIYRVIVVRDGKIISIKHNENPVSPGGPSPGFINDG